MAVTYQFLAASGRTHVDCHALAMRYDDRVGPHPDSSERFVLQVTGATAHVLLHKVGWYTGLWRSPSGRVFVTDSREGVHMNFDPAPRAAPWRTERLAGVVTGVWGLDDGLVLAWGLGDAAGEHVMFRWDGARWHAMPSPGPVTAVHGTAPDLLYAVGMGGLIARWDGGRWVRVPSPTRHSLAAVHVASADEMYAAGAFALLEGSSHGWVELAAGSQAFTCVARLRDRVFVGGMLDGLCELRGRAVVPVKPKLAPQHLEVREGLLAACPDVLAFTADGAAFEGTFVKTFEDLCAGIPVPWRVSAADYGSDDGGAGGGDGDLSD